MSTMEKGYRPPAEFQVDDKDPLVEISLTDSTDLWLIQWPINQPYDSDFNGQELSLKLHHDGRIGRFESSSGKSYELVSFTAQEPDATVFLSSPSESKVVGKISRRVSLVHYPEPTELEKPISNHPSRLSGRSETSTHSHKHKSSHSRSRMSHSIVTPSVSSRKKNSPIISEGPSGGAKKRGTVESTSMDRSTRDSGAGRSDVTSLGSAEHSHHKKSRKIIKDEQ